MNINCRIRHICDLYLEKDFNSIQFYYLRFEN